MKKKSIMLIIISIFLLQNSNAQSPENILLKDYRPVSIYKIPVSKIMKAKYR